MARSPSIDWRPVFQWADENSAGATAVARHFGLNEGTVAAALSRRRLLAQKAERPALCSKCGATV